MLTSFPLRDGGGVGEVRGVVFAVVVVVGFGVVDVVVVGSVIVVGSVVVVCSVVVVGSMVVVG